MHVHAARQSRVELAIFQRIRRCAHATLTEAGPRISWSLMRSASRTHYEPGSYLIVQLQTPRLKERRNRVLAPNQCLVVFFPQKIRRDRLSELGLRTAICGTL